MDGFCSGRLGCCPIEFQCLLDDARFGDSLAALDDLDLDPLHHVFRQIETEFLLCVGGGLHDRLQG